LLSWVAVPFFFFTPFCTKLKVSHNRSTRPEVKTSLNVLVTVHVTFDRKRLTTQI
jgi:hypothetical protein